MTDETTSAQDGEQQKCPCCGGTDIFAGRSSVFKVPFVPDTPILKYARSYLPQQYACLTCGFMGFMLKESELVKLRKEKEARGS